MSTEYVSKTEVARRLGVSKMAVSHACKEGRITEAAIVRDERRAILGLLPDIAIRDYHANTDVSMQRETKPSGRPPREKPPAGPDAPPAPASAPATPAREARPRERPRQVIVPEGEGGENAAESFAAARARKEGYAAELARLEYEKAVGLVVDAEEVTKAWEKLVSEAKTKMLALPSQAKAQIPHLTKGDVRLIEDLVRQALEGLSRWQQPKA